MSPLRTPHFVALAAALLLVVSVAGLVDKGASSEGSGSSPEGAVTIVDFTFEPDTISAAPGDTVTWINEDGAAHTVTSDGDGPLDSRDLEKGDRYEASFEQPGTYAYICTIHPTMRGTVEVSA